MRFEGIGFNEKWISLQKETDIVKHPAFQNYWPRLTAEARKARLKELHKVCSLVVKSRKGENGTKHVRQRN